MLNYKIILIEISLVVTSTIRHTSADDRIETCEKLINEAEIFDAGEDKGKSNFIRAFKNLTLGKIESWIDKFPGSSGNASLIKLQKELNVKYFQSLPNGLNEDVYFKEPYIWCSDKVDDFVEIGYIDIKQSRKKQVSLCKRYIVEVLYKIPEFGPGKRGLVKAMYTNWCGKMISNIIQDKKDIYNELYTLGYFNHVANYVMDERHIPEGFKSIKQFCTDEGYKLLTSELDH